MSAASTPKCAPGTKEAEMTFTEFMERAAQAFEVFAVAVLIVGMVWSLLYSAWVWRTSGDGRRGYALLREFFNDVLLLGVEILVATDLIRISPISFGSASRPSIRTMRSSVPE